MRLPIHVNEWSTDARWLERCNPPFRWLSTNHLVGEGYWVWLIPLASGSHSVGIVADGRKIHPWQRINSFARAMEWLREFQPRLADDLETMRDLLQDFAFLKHFSHGCKKVFSGARWAMTGESGVFLDPFYSPGSYFIAIANTYITELIAHDRGGQPVASYARIYEQFFMSFCDSTMSLYRDQYALFGDPEVLPVKVIWDYTYYWGVLCQLFFQRRLTDLTMLSRLRDELGSSKAHNYAIQDFLRQWSTRSARHNPPVLLDQVHLDWFAELNRGLRDELDDAAFKARIRTTTRQLRQLAREIVATACAQHPGCSTLRATRERARARRRRTGPIAAARRQLTGGRRPRPRRPRTRCRSGAGAGATRSDRRRWWPGPRRRHRRPGRGPGR